MEEKKCSVCGKKHYAKGYCRNHYAIWHRTGSFKSAYMKNKGITCSVDGCPIPAFTKGACKKHYHRWWAHGSYEKKIYKGKDHWSWKGGKSPYPGHYTLKKNRLTKLKQVNNKCEDCGAFANWVIHKDGSDSNHAVENLKAVCQKCWGKNTKLHGKSKYKNKYGPMKELARKHSISEGAIYQRLRKGMPPNGRGGGRRGRPKKILLTETLQGENRA